MDRQRHPDGRPPQRSGQPDVLARLAQDGEAVPEPLTPPRWARPLGRLLCLALLAGTVVAALRIAS